MVKITRPEGQDSTPLTPGEYPGIVLECVESESRAGNPMLVIEVEVKFNPNRTRKMKCWYPLHVAFRVDQLYTAFPNAIDDDGTLDSDLIEGSVVLADVINELYEGEKKLKLNKVFPAEDAEEEEGSADDCPF